MDPSVLSIRKALYNSYKNESFKLKERQRQAMAQQRRDEMETNRIFRNRLKEIKEKEKEISQRYAHLRKFSTENDKSRYTEVAMEKGNCSRQKILILPAINASEMDEENRRELYQSDNHISRGLRRFNKPHRSVAETKLSRQYSNRVSWQQHKSEMQLLSPELNSKFTENVLNYYKSPKTLSGIDKSYPSQVIDKKTNVCTLTLEKQSSYKGKRGAFNTYSPDYDILIVEHEEDRSSRAEF